MFIGRTNAEAKTPILWPPDAKSWLIWKDPNVGKDWGQEEKVTTEAEMVGWHRRLNGHKFGWTWSGSWWWTGRPDMLWFMGSQRVGHDWVTELNWTDQERSIDCLSGPWHVLIYWSNEITSGRAAAVGETIWLTLWKSVFVFQDPFFFFTGQVRQVE